MTAPSDPDWLPEALAKCPAEGAEMERRAGALRALPMDAPMVEFVRLYEQKCAARDRLYAAWIATAMDDA